MATFSTTKLLMNNSDIVAKLAQKEITPPYIPIFDPGDNEFTSNFDTQFTREPADLTPDDS